MSELSFSSKNSDFSSIDLLAHFFHACSFILSHALYLSYFIFFSPYLIKLLSFLSPLFITTALLVLAYLSISPNSTSSTTYQTVVAKLQYPKVDHNNVDDHEEFRSLEELEVYKIVFHTSSLEVRESQPEEMSSKEAFDAPIEQNYSLGGNGSIGYFLEAASAILEEIRNSPAEEMRSEQALVAPNDESFSLEGNSKTGNLLDGAIWEESEENPDDRSSSTQVFDEAFSERSSPEGSESSGFFSESSSVSLEQNPVEKKCSSQASDAPVVEKSSPKGSGSTNYFFEASSAVLEETRENQVKEKFSSQVSDAQVDKSSSLESKDSTGNVLEAATVILERKAVGEVKGVKSLSAYFNKVADEEEKRSKGRESKAGRDLGANNGRFRSKSMVLSSPFLGSNLGNAGVKAPEDPLNMGPNLGSFGSMRKEKEWRRTLACKLFEERHQNVDGGAEGMDMLWETYDETESSKAEQGIKSKSKKQGKMIINGHKVDNNEVDDNEEEDDEELDNAQLCCLQALKFSAGKMNLGHMGRPNIVKITKAIKGFGWLHHVTNKHSKKGYH